MTEAELYAALEAATKRTAGGEGVTVQEIVDATGLQENRIRRAIRDALRSGRATRCTKHMENIAGRITAVPSYRLTEPAG